MLEGAPPERPDETKEEIRLPQPRHAVGFFLLLIASFFAAIFLLVFLLESLGIELDFSSQVVNAFLTVVQALVTFGVIWIFLQWGRFSTKGTLSLQPAPRSAYVWGPVGMIALGVVTAQMGALLVRAFPELASENLAELVRLSRFTDVFSFVLYALAISLGPGISEELAFRGVMLAGFRARYSPTTAITLSALLFALMHLDTLHILLTFPAGLWLGFLVVRTRSIYPAIASHALNNLWSTLEAAYWQAVQPGIDPMEIVLGLYPWAVVLIALGMLLIALWGLQGLTPSDRAGSRGA